MWRVVKGRESCVGKGDKTLLSSIDLFKGHDNDILTGIFKQVFSRRDWRLGKIGSWPIFPRV